MFGHLDVPLQHFFLEQMGHCTSTIKAFPNCKAWWKMGKDAELVTMWNTITSIAHTLKQSEMLLQDTMALSCLFSFPGKCNDSLLQCKLTFDMQPSQFPTD